MKVRWNPKQQRFPTLTRNLVVDTFRGQIRVRKWPRKRGPSKSAAVLRQNKWFTDANHLAKRLWPDQIKLAMRLTEGTGLYPRDLLLRQMSGGIYDLFTGEGVHYQPRTFFRETKMFQGVILELAIMHTFTAGVASFVTWPLPILDTLGFWNVAQPDRITIPAGINVVEMTAGLTLTPDGNRFDILILPVVGGVGIEANGIGQNVNSKNVATGPHTVTVGDQFRVRGFSNATRATAAFRRNFFVLNVLDAD